MVVGTLLMMVMVMVMMLVVVIIATMVMKVEVQSQQMVFTQSPSLSNNPNILNNYFIFAMMVMRMRIEDE